MKEVVVMIGLPGSGKTTYIRERFEGRSRITIVSPDEIRREFYSDISIQGDAVLVFREAYKRVSRALEDNNTVIFDATNTTHHRANFIKNLRDLGVDKISAIYINTPFDICLIRNEERTDRAEPVPFDIMTKMYSQMIRSESSLFSEDFDDILVINYKREDGSSQKIQTP